MLEDAREDPAEQSESASSELLSSFLTLEGRRSSAQQRDELWLLL